MRRRHAGDRGVSNIIGTIIIFGFVVTLVVLLQVAAVPVWNENVEYEHSGRVQGDMGGLRDSISLSSATGRSTAQTVEVGVRYPTRALFVNPTNPSGTVSSLSAGTVTVENAVAVGDEEARDYWDGATREFTTRSVGYVPDYSEYENAPTTYIDNGVLFNAFEDGAQSTSSDQSLVSGRRINLNLVGGRLSRSSVQPVSVGVNPVSAPSEAITVGGDTTGGVEEPVTVTVPTVLSEQRWDELLEDERVANGGYVAETRYTAGEPYNSLTVELEPGEYTLRASKVAVGPTDEAQEPRYVVARGGTSRSVETDSNETFVVEVRDRYNNPVSGVLVNATLTGDGDVYPVEPTTGEDGVASFEYVAPGTVGTAGVELSIGDSSEAYERVTFAVDVVEPTGGGGSGGGDEPGFDQGGDSGVLLSGVTRLTGGSSNVAEVRFRNTGATKEVVDAKFISYYDSQPNCPCGDRLRVGGTGPTLTEGGARESLTTPFELTGGATTTVTFEVSSTGGGGRFSVRGQDFALVEFGFSDGTRSTYMVQFNSN